jgi:hypothetical protein
MAEKVDSLVNHWNAELDMAREARRTSLLDWKYWEAVYNDRLWGIMKKGKRRSRQNESGLITQVNELESIVLSILPRILFHRPIFLVTADSDDYRLSALFWEKVAEVIYDMRGLGMKANVKENVVDALILGGGVHKTGFGYELEQPEYTGGDGTAGEPEIKNDMVITSWISPKRVLLDYRVERWIDKRWIAEEIDKPLQEVKANKVYKNTRSLNASKTSRWAAFRARKNLLRTVPEDMVTLFEIHDLQNSQIITIADGHNKVLRKDDDYGFELHDYLEFTPSRPREIYGKSLTQSIEEHMIRLAKANYYMDSHMKRAGLSKILYDKAYVDRAARRALNSMKDFELVAVDGLVEGKTPVQEFRGTPTTMDWQVATRVIGETIRMLTGVTQQERGKHEVGVQTAYETAKLFQASDARNQDRVLALNDYIESIMIKMLRIMNNNWPMARICDLVGLDPIYAPLIKPFDRMKLKIKFGSTALERQAIMRENLLGFAQFAQAAGIPLNPEGFMKIAVKAFDLDLGDVRDLLGTGAEPGAAGTQPPATAPGSLPQGGGRNVIQLPA